MKSVKNILITCAGGSSSIYLAKQLQSKYKIHLVNGSDQTVAKYLGLPFSKVPFGNHPGYIKAIDTLAKKWHIDCIVPGADEELIPISKYAGKHGLMAVIPSADFISLCLNKKTLMHKLDECGISNLLPFEAIKNVRYPAIAKPIYGRGSRQVHVVHSKSQLQGYLNLYKQSFSDILVQPFIEGTEYTVSVMVSRLNQLIGVISKRIIKKRGITGIAVTEKNDLISTAAENIVRSMAPKGPFNIQLKIFKGKVFIFEINPRLSTTSVLTDRSFGNEVELYIKSFDNIITSPKVKEGVYLYRYEENKFYRDIH